jgi:voltage-gated potassium channel Kch
LHLERTGIATARLLLVTLPDPLATRQILTTARRLAPALEIVARVASEGERLHLAREHGADGVLAEMELAIEMARLTLLRFGVSQIEAQAITLDLRRGGVGSRGGARVVEVRIGADSAAVDGTLAALRLGKGILVMAIDRGGALLVPDGSTVLRAGDLLLVITDSAHPADLAALR